jgi:hypothetical protein
MKKLLFILPVLAIFGGCSLLDQYKSSPQYARFCEWQPVATTAIQSAAMEALKDPKKQRVGQSLSEAGNFLQMMAAGCPRPTEVKA